MNEKTIIEKLQSLARSLPPPRMGMIEGRVRRALRTPRPERMPRFRLVMGVRSVAVAVLVVLAIAVSGGTVFAAQGALPGGRLYPLKLVSERIAYRNAASGEQRLDLALTSARRRIDELEALNRRSPARAVEFFAQNHRAFTQAIQAVDAAFTDLAGRQPPLALAGVVVFEAEIDSLISRGEEIGASVGMVFNTETLRTIQRSTRTTIDRFEHDLSGDELEKSSRALYDTLRAKANEVDRLRVSLGEIEVPLDVSLSLEHAREKLREAMASLDRGAYREGYEQAKESYRFWRMGERELQRLRATQLPASTNQPSQEGGGVPPRNTPPSPRAVEVRINGAERSDQPQE